MKYLIIIIVTVLIPVYCIAQNEQCDKSGTITTNKGKSMRKEKDIYGDIGRFLNRYPIEKYQVQVDGHPISRGGIIRLITLLRGCSWKTEDFKPSGSFAEPYANIGIKVKGVRKKLELLVSANGIDVSDWSRGGDFTWIGGGGPTTVDVYGNYEQYTMYVELIPKINEIIFETIADFKNVEIVDTLTVLAKRIDHTVGGLVESVPMSNEDNAEFLRLYNHTIHSTIHLGGDLRYEQPSGIEYIFVYGQNVLLQISNYARGTHEFTENIFSEADAKAMTKLKNKYIALLDSLGHPDGGFAAALPPSGRIEGCCRLQYVYRCMDGNREMLEAYDDEGKKRELK